MTDNFTQYFDTKIYWTDEIDGCGNTMIDDFLDATSFITQDKKFYIINSFNGDELWSHKMSHPGSAPPLIFEDENEQYIIVPAFEGGGKKIYAFKSGEENQ